MHVPPTTHHDQPVSVPRRLLAHTLARTRQWLLDPAYWRPALHAVLLAECALNALIVARVPYTEIDWRTYMTQVSHYWAPHNSTSDYAHLVGPTGPLVYPAAHFWLFSLLYMVTGAGAHIRTAQCLYILVYLLEFVSVARIYERVNRHYAATQRTPPIPPYVLYVIAFTSYRVHSIHVLRLFNDPLAMLFLYVSVNLFLERRWTLGSVCYSVGVGVKMNVLLFAPALLLVYCRCLGAWRTALQLLVCGAVQTLLAVPFLLANARAYLLSAFDVRRVFLYRWTVNWRFVAESVFLDRRFHVALLGAHLCLLLLLLCVFVRRTRAWKRTAPPVTATAAMAPPAVVVTLFACNLVGVLCSRSLHYQFYVWYYHTLPVLLWTGAWPVHVRLLLLFLLELCWNTYPAGALSSAVMFCCHVCVLGGVVRSADQVLR